MPPTKNESQKAVTNDLGRCWAELSGVDAGAPLFIARIIRSKIEILFSGCRLGCCCQSQTLGPPFCRGRFPVSGWWYLLVVLRQWLEAKFGCSLSALGLGSYGPTLGHPAICSSSLLMNT